ncbi:putative secreted RxLR effector protein [Phytophthora cinnamomi]|uniref:putative secreted RxLR effector protein n=1 Tax=Phytophthora cinnamomi TaxID=4785 RepID=UPI002A2DFB03|nr:putative secreted RxLR effector protein [Phytophthora cinnamomi]KAG6610562.1 putative secreted RxLR effector protein [Phytophthora cinnamomi]KAJ8539004.1 hypothetical protein ON010_g12867 [Phytophthora cinnamomi]
MRLGYLVLVAITGILACDAAVASNSKTSKLVSPDQAVGRELTGAFDVNDIGKRSLRSAEEKDSRDDLKTNAGTADEEERDLIVSTFNRPKYWRWFHAGMTPYAVKEVLGLTGVRRLWKPIKRREYEGYVVFYDEHCRKPKYRSFCRAHAGA